MKYTAEELRTLCIEALGGAEASSYNVTSIYYKVLKPVLLSLGYTEDYLMHNIYVHTERYTLMLQYRSKKMISGRWDTGFYTIMTINGKRKKGATHYSIFSGTYADYTWKDFEVNLYGYSTLEEAVQGVITSCAKSAETANDLLYRIYSAMREAFPELKEYEIREVIKTISNNTYTLEDMYNKLHEKKV